jgi:hypothetical protein
LERAEGYCKGRLDAVITDMGFERWMPEDEPGVNTLEEAVDDIAGVRLEVAGRPTVVASEVDREVVAMLALAVGVLMGLILAEDDAVGAFAWEEFDSALADRVTVTPEDSAPVALLLSPELSSGA